MYAVKQIEKFLSEHVDAISAEKAKGIMKRAGDANQGDGLFVPKSLTKIFSDTGLEAEFRKAAATPEYLKIEAEVMGERNKAAAAVVASQT